jgi:hypothetical protein
MTRRSRARGAELEEGAGARDLQEDAAAEVGGGDGLRVAGRAGAVRRGAGDEVVAGLVGRPAEAHRAALRGGGGQAAGRDGGGGEVVGGDGLEALRRGAGVGGVRGGEHEQGEGCPEGQLLGRPDGRQKA